VLKVDQKRHLVLKSVHPSPLSAARGYFTCGHFRAANEWLAERYGVAGRVDWSLVEGGSVFEGEAEEKKEGEKEKEEVEDVKTKGEDGKEGKIDGEVVEEGVVKKVEATAAVGGDAENKEKVKETVVKTKAATKAEDGDENSAPEVEA
jgi:uracil-DNA glycosylase